MRTYGRIRLSPPTKRGYRMLGVTCEPSVRARFRRCFPRVSMHATETLNLKATDEVCRDLLWFAERFPLEMDDDVRAALQTGCARHVDRESAVQRLMQQRQPALPFELALPPREYQRQAAEMLLTSRGLLVADDVGLGKTCTAICAMTQADALPALVVCPTHLPRQWAAQIALFAPHLTTHVATKGAPYPIRHVMRGGNRERREGMPDVLILNYHKLRGWSEELAGAVRYVVFDEAQQLRSYQSQIWSAAKHVAEAATYRLGLSATPIYNYGMEFHSVFDVLAPDALGTREEFGREWCGGDGDGKAKVRDAAVFGVYLRDSGLMVRRTRREVGRELPALSKVVHEIDADVAPIANAQQGALALARIILQANESYRGQKMQAAAEFDSLMRQATGIAKAPHVAAFVRLLLESEQKVILFGWHRAVYSVWLEQLAEFNPVLYTGSESDLQKRQALERFLDPAGTCRVFIMSLRSGAGVDGLQHVCRTAVLGELDWSPGVHEQCVGRLHRDGQTEPVVAYFLAAEEGADPIMVEVLGIKRAQSEPVRNPGAPLAEVLDRGADSIRRLAEDALRRAGEPIPQEPVLALTTAGADA